MMLSTPRILSALGVAGGVIVSAIVGVLMVDVRASDLRTYFLERAYALPVWLVAVALVVLIAVLIFLNDRVWRRDEQVRVLKAEIDSLEHRLKHEIELRFVDLVTGVPNDSKWQVDIEHLAASVANGAPCHIALIDLVDFGRLNNELGYAKVDEILKYVAQTIENGMRRSEGLYRKQGEHGGMRPDRLYRKYPGGDEFYIVVEAAEHEMLGLLSRLQATMMNDMKAHIDVRIAKMPIPLHFSGAVCELYPNEKSADVTKRLIEGLQRARYPNAPRRLIWQSGITSSQCKGDPRERANYEKAETVFKNEAAAGQLS